MNGRVMRTVSEPKPNLGGEEREEEKKMSGLLKARKANFSSWSVTGGRRRGEVMDKCTSLSSSSPSKANSFACSRSLDEVTLRKIARSHFQLNGYTTVKRTWRQLRGEKVKEEGVRERERESDGREGRERTSGEQQKAEMEAERAPITMVEEWRDLYAIAKKERKEQKERKAKTGSEEWEGEEEEEDEDDEDDEEDEEEKRIERTLKEAAEKLKNLKRSEQPWMISEEERRIMANIMNQSLGVKGGNAEGVVEVKMMVKEC